MVIFGRLVEPPEKFKKSIVASTFLLLLKYVNTKS